MAEEAKAPEGATEKAQEQPNAQAAAGSSEESLTVESMAKLIKDQIDAAGIGDIGAQIDKAVKKAVKPLRAELGRQRQATKAKPASKNTEDDDDAIDFGAEPKESGIGGAALIRDVRKVERELVRQGFSEVLRADPELEDAVNESIFDRLERGDTAEEATLYAIGQLFEPSLQYVAKVQAASAAKAKEGGTETDAKNQETTEEEPDDVVPVEGAAAGGASEPNGISAVSQTARGRVKELRSLLPNPDA